VFDRIAQPATLGHVALLPAIIVAFAAGASVAAALVTWSARRSRGALARRVVSAVRPVLERRAVALGVPLGATEVGMRDDGELEIRGAGDELARVLQLADSIDAREQGQLGYLDTVRVSKDAMDGGLVEKSGQRTRRA
jgi:hypothetical protein